MVILRVNIAIEGLYPKSLLYKAYAANLMALAVGCWIQNSHHCRNCHSQAPKSASLTQAKSIAISRCILAHPKGTFLVQVAMPKRLSDWHQAG